jgi:hypothetical protein
MANGQDKEDPNTTIVVIAPNGQDVYKLTMPQWTGETPGATKIIDAQQLLLPQQVRAANAYVAFPQTVAASIGLTCTIVNLRAILNNQRAVKVSTNAEAPGTGAAAGPGTAVAGPGGRPGGRG